MFINKIYKNKTNQHNIIYSTSFLMNNRQNYLIFHQLYEIIILLSWSFKVTVFIAVLLCCLYSIKRIFENMVQFWNFYKTSKIRNFLMITFAHVIPIYCLLKFSIYNYSIKIKQNRNLFRSVH